MIDLLLSYAHHAKTDLGAVRAALGPEGRLMVDSGAYTAFTKGRVIELAEYAAFLRHWHGTYDYAITLDVIGDPVATARNTEALAAEGVDVMPVFTARASFDELDAMAAQHKYLALGGLVGVPREMREQLTAAVVRRVAPTRVHSLGQAGQRIFEVAGVHSGDASTPNMMPLTGRMPLFTGRRQLTWLLAEPEPWRAHGPLLRAYGLRAREMLSGEAVRSEAARVRLFRAATLAFAAQGAYLRRNTGTEWPRVYTAVVIKELLEGAMQAARDWRNGALPPQLARLFA